ncbi:aldo/keto reductase [Leptolyngbya cf. ectocarpi LEGE 11479]|uniref:Aldo/keto reductase n=1 Tax=Leptolyngbya cf. ectocarpi LEGE 11479 TaxID=1828722 RepID=A0A928ZZX7_LEPEC|nr:aldo/keto reductase [Leptolyngbya ectocarpi]MBE9070609.1 aldo/keto reductase [Leptolyngbya cf. ectocarpi LEGE 11479]
MKIYRRNGRRQFLATSVTTALGLIGCSTQQQKPTAAPLDEADTALVEAASSPISLTTPAAMPQRILGRTQVELPILGLGGAGRTPLSSPDQEQAAIDQIQQALTLGIRYFDTAASYGPSEQYLGKVLPPYRSEIFLASKTAVFDYDGAWRQLERSLRRLNTDYLDLWQFHHVSFEAELDTLFGNNGAIKALEDAKAQGLVRFSGITGHHEPQVIATGLQRYPFDHTLIPVNAADIHHPRPFIPTVLVVAQAQNVGVTAMKVPAYGRLLKPGVLDGMHQALGYTLSQAGVHCAVIAAETIAQLEENVRAATKFQMLNETDLANIEQKTATVWQDNTFFRAWT